MDPTITLAFIIIAFALGGVLVWKKDTVPPKLRRTLALCALFFMLFAFFLIVYSFATAGA